MGSWQYGLIFSNAESFLNWMQGKRRVKITEVHVHHTYKPDHSDFNGRNHRALQDNMRNYHMNTNGWSDIAQHVTIYPDGFIMTGRDINQPPASAMGYNDSDPDNEHPFMFELLGNFDVGHDKLQGKQLETAVKVTRYFYEKGAGIRFHRQCLINGKMPKTCPGTGVDYDWFVSLVKGSAPITPAVPKPPSVQNPAPSVGQRILKLTSPMMQGEDVKKVQLRVRATPDGVYGPETQHRVCEFQKAMGLVTDGIVGPKTWAALFPSYPGYLLKRGSKGTAVRQVQWMLGGLVVDGVFGEKTEAKVKEFQRKKGLAVDGIVGPATWKALFG